MAEIETLHDELVITLSTSEKEQLLVAIDILEEKIGVVPRTTPHAYSDLAMEAEYRRLTWPSVQEGRRSDIDEVRANLRRRGPSFRLTQEGAWAWVRALNHLRMAAAGVLGIVDEDWHSHAGEWADIPEYQALHALTWIQGALVEFLTPSEEETVIP